MKRLQHWSIASRLATLFGGMLLLILGLFSVSIYNLFHWSLHENFDQHLRHEAMQLLPYVHPDTLQMIVPVEHLPALQATGMHGTYVRLLSTDGRVTFASANLATYAEPLPVQLPGKPQPVSLSRTWENLPLRTLLIPVQAQDGTLRGWLEVSGFEWNAHSELRRLKGLLLLAVLTAVLLSLAGGYLLARQALSPVARITEAARQIQTRALDQRLPVPVSPRDELTELAETFNQMLDRLQEGFTRERRFIANAAHELMTPLAVLRSNLDIGLRRPRKTETYRELLEQTRAEIVRLSASVRQLLQLSRISGADSRTAEEIDLGILFTRLLPPFEQQAAEKQIQLSWHLPPGFVYRGHPSLLGEILSNLLSNALKYTPAGGTVHVALQQTRKGIVLVVEDTGIGFSEEVHAQIFERFYRTTEAEQVAEGTGLGLSIVQAIVEHYGGTVKAWSPGPGKGSRFTVVLPFPDSEQKP